MIQNFIRRIASVSTARLVFFLMGIGSTVWFLIRVLPKPSRAAYPCMRASAPVMSAFVIYLTGLGSTLYLFKTQKGRMLLLKGTLFLVFVGSLLFSFRSTDESSNAGSLVEASSFIANEPIGAARGIFPGRVVWVRNPDATNGQMTNKSGDFWFMDKNCPQAAVDSMLVSGIRRIAGKAANADAWDAIFRYFNQTHGKGMAGYTPGEKIAIKINLTNSSVSSTGMARMDAAPQMVLALLKQLVEVVGVAQRDIWIGDNYRLFREEYWNKCHPVFPDVHYVDGTGKNGREKTNPSAGQVLVFSDGQATSSLPQHYLDAAYLINMSCLKSHDCGGITIAAKNHQGSVLKARDKPENQSAYYLHYSLPKPPSGIQKTGQYRHLVDFMAHKDLGGKTLLYLVDGLWAGRNWEGIVEKWEMAPFNNDYPSSLFLSQDAVAIESVCFDFLLTEYETKASDIRYPYLTGTDDYMKQAADPSLWPAGITYDPEGDGTSPGSLGVHEHWNNPGDKQYSRNLGTGNGIELLKYASLPADNYQDEITGMEKPLRAPGYKIYPNPFSRTLRIDLHTPADIRVSIYDLRGSLVFRDFATTTCTWNGISGNGTPATGGTYLVKLEDRFSGELLGIEKVVCDPGRK